MSCSTRVIAIPLLLLFLGLVNLSFGLKCIVCNSEYDEECEASPPPNKYLSECGEGSEDTILKWHTGPKPKGGEHKPEPKSEPIISNFTLCRKIHITIPPQVNKGTNKEEKGRTVRLCGHMNSLKEGEDKSCRWIAADYVQTQICTCSGDGCNPAGPGPTSSFVLLLIPFTIATLQLAI